MPEEPTGSPEEMSEESTDTPEEQRRKIRRKLLKLGAYTSVAVITSFVASKSAFAVHPQHCLPKSGHAQVS